jgi:hypothetical protein
MGDREHELDDDSVNALNAEVAKQREEALSDEHLLYQRAGSAGDHLRQAATHLRIYEALKGAGR